MKRSLCVALAAAWLAAFSLPAFADEVSCEGFVLGFDGDVKKMTCETKDVSTAAKEYESSTIEVADQTFWLWVSYYHTTNDTIIHPISVDRWLAQTHDFTHVQKLGISRHLGGFEVIAFNGVADGEKYVSSCGFFVRYFDQATSYGAGVFRKLIQGLYCAEPGFLTPEQENTGFYDVMEQVIGKLRLPKNDD